MKIVRVFMIAICLATSLPAIAADDDLTSSAYLVFDPETGEFVTVQDPDRSKQDHAARDPATAPVADTKAPPQPAGVALAIALFAAAVWLQLRKARS